jgi:ethanolamine-phosphate cytidylyltransferase
VVAGVHTDAEVHEAKGGVFPVMSIFERGLCVLQCRVGLLEPLQSTFPANDSSTSRPSSSPRRGIYHAGFSPPSRMPQVEQETQLQADSKTRPRPISSTMARRPTPPRSPRPTSTPMQWGYLGASTRTHGRTSTQRRSCSGF